MTAYLVLLLAVLSRILPYAFHQVNLGFTAVGGGLLYFGARRSRWQTVFAVLALMATDYFLTAFVFSYPFHAKDYLVTWGWEAAICLMAHQVLSRKASALRVGGAVVACSTSFFFLSNFAVWMSGTMYPHTAIGLGACYVAGIPFYANDLISTAFTAAALFGLPALARNVAHTLREAQNNNLPMA